jgi:tRNA modification GTPase
VNSPDTIVAAASPPGRGAVGVIRLSGPDVPQLALQILGSVPPARVATFANFRDAQGRVLDQGLALYFPAPHSFTGEAVLELQGHGGPVVIDLLLRRLLELGCRSARPGEFSERAFLNGKIDLTQAEAVADLIDAGSEAAARAALRTLSGEFSHRVAELQASLGQLRVYVEAAIDFPDEEIDWLSDAALSERLNRVFASFDAMAAAARQGSRLRDGLNVVIAGKPNAGKSSVMNALAGDDVAIVTATAGTTRDLLRQLIHIDGFPINLVDTAGLRDSNDAVEVEGVRRARNELAHADLILYVVDAQASAPSAEELGRLPANVALTLIYNKIDLAGIPALAVESPPPARVYLSALTGEGVDLLRGHLFARAGGASIEGGAFAARSRHIDALRRAHEHAQAAVAVLREQRAYELFAEELRLAQSALGEITGQVRSDELLGQIFGSFCIGK